MITTAKTIGAILAILQGVTQIQSGPMSMDQAIQYAENNAFAMRIQKSIIEKNRQKVNEARGNLGPQITLGGTYTRYDSSIEASLGPGQTFVVRPIQLEENTATLNLPIDIAGNLSRVVRANKATARASEITLNGTYNDTRLNVRQAYFTVLRAKAQIDVDQKALDDAQGRLDQGQKQFDQQQVAKLDVTRYQAAVAQAQSDLISAKDSLTLANYAFNLALARPIETSVTLVDVNEMPALPPSEEALVQVANANRPEVLSAIENLKALALLTRVAESSLDPSLNLQIQYQQLPGSASFGQSTQSTVGTLALSIPIFDSGVAHAKVREARQDEVQARVNLDQTKLGISQEVRNAVANMASAKARFENATAQVGLAEEVFRLAKVKQDAGAGTYYEVIDAESQLTLARNGLVSARYDYLTSYSQLQRAIGSDAVGQAAVDSQGTYK